ncbi:hypothetical protein DL764_007179 [Monosporascus ibericus]|uniref:Peptide hydrolase n=1 Tax=Monosporascus ibericus TaxID=155417 RepID=A0A4Q4T2U2_9PEZI|nr:hypothetical protein DL764_007179 [Monosporascus ibericus]
MHMESAQESGSMDIQQQDGRELLRGQINKLRKEIDALQAENKTSQYRLSLLSELYQAVESKLVRLEPEHTKLGEDITEIYRTETTRRILSIVCAGDKRESPRKTENPGGMTTVEVEETRTATATRETGAAAAPLPSGAPPSLYDPLVIFDMVLKLVAHDLPKHNEAIHRYQNRQYRESAQSLNEALALAKEAQYRMFIYMVAVCWSKTHIELSPEDVAPAAALDAPESPGGELSCAGRLCQGFIETVARPHVELGRNGLQRGEIWADPGLTEDLGFAKERLAQSSCEVNASFRVKVVMLDKHKGEDVWKTAMHYLTGSRQRAVYVRFIIVLVVYMLLACALAYEELSDEALRSIPSGAADFDVDTGLLLAPILIPRVPGTPGSLAVQHHFANFFAQQLPEWKLQWHNSTSKTPATGDAEVPFSNLIFTRDPPWAEVGDVGRLTLVAHYDSLYRPEGFIGAIDSAASCAMLMHVARSIDHALTKKWNDLESSGMAGLGLEEEKGVQIVFLDGEEAFVTWTATDSLYGARALAERWEAEAYSASAAYRSPLDSIDLFLLLDLLGAADPRVQSYFQETHWAYQRMAKLEERMRKLGLLKSTPKRPFLPESRKHPVQFSSAYVQDDHVPFMVRGVPVLHIIPMPFPPVWHTMEDDGEHLDPATVDDWAKIITAFATEWMELDGIINQPAEKRHEDGDKTEL